MFKRVIKKYFVRILCLVLFLSLGYSVTEMPLFKVSSSGKVQFWKRYLAVHKIFFLESQKSPDRSLDLNTFFH